MSSQSKTLRILRPLVRALLVVFALFWSVFALLSGATQSGQGIGAVLHNLPNALPWLVLVVFVYIAFRWELVGGILIALTGLVSIIFLNALSSPVVLFVISLPLVVLGGALILCWVLRPRRTP